MLLLNNSGECGDCGLLLKALLTCCVPLVSDPSHLTHVICLWYLILVAWLSLYTKKGGKIPRMEFDQLAFSSPYKYTGAPTMGGDIPCIRCMYLPYHIEVMESTSMWEEGNIHRIHCVFSPTLEVLKLLKCYFSTPKKNSFAISSLWLFSLSELTIGTSELSVVDLGY